MSLVAFKDYSECAWSEMAISIAGGEVAKIRGVKYSVESDDELLHAAGDLPLSIQSGNVKFMGSFKFLKGAIDDLRVAAKAAGARWITDLRFDIVVAYLESGDGRPLQVDTLVGCKMGKMEKGWEQGTKYMDMEIPVLFLNLIEA